MTQAELKKIMHYDPETGVCMWIKRRRRAILGKPIGSNHCAGYLVVSINNKNFLLHRLVYMYMEGYLPEHQIDHINGDMKDNRWVNLRHVSNTCNLQNCKVSKNNTSGFPSVCFRKETKRWIARATYNSKDISLGTHSTKLDAALARLTWEVNCDKWTCNERGELVKAIKEAWPEFNDKCL